MVTKPLGIAVHDHLIIGRNGHASLTSLLGLAATRMSSWARFLRKYPDMSREVMIQRSSSIA
jgi:hypothetical protein